MNKYALSLFLLFSFIAGNMTVSPLYAMDLTENLDGDLDSDAQKGIWDRVQDFTDSVILQVGKISGVGAAFKKKYDRHCDSFFKSYEGNCYLGDSVIFCKGAVFNDVNNSPFNSTDNVLKFIGSGSVNGKKCWFGAVSKGGRAYQLNYENKTNTVTGVEPLQRPGFHVIFKYDTLLYEQRGEANLMNKQGHELVYRNGVPVRTKSGELLFECDMEYFDYAGSSIDLTSDDIDGLPTIYENPHPVIAVSAVLTATGAVGLGSVFSLWKAIKWGHKKLLGGKQKDQRGGWQKRRFEF